MRWVEIFSAGNKTSRQGVEQDFPLSRLASAVESYDPKQFRAPLLVKHDTKGVADHVVADQPFCFGFPQALQIVGDKLKAGFETIAPEFLEWVANGNLISCSSSFYTENDPRNPTPGKLHLRHVAALGSDLPSVKNLGSLNELLEYAEGEEFDHAVDGNWLVEFQDPVPDPAVQKIADLEKRIAVLEQPTQPVQELDFMDWDDIVAWAIRQAVAASPKSPAEIAAAADMTPERLDIILGKDGEGTYDEIQKLVPALGIDGMDYSEPSPRELAMRQREATLAQREAELRRQQVTEFMEPLVVAGQVLPGDRNALETVLLHLESSQPLEFAEGDGLATKSPAAVVKDWLGRLKPQVDYSQRVPGEDELIEVPEYGEPAGYTVGHVRLKQLAQAKSYAAKNGCSLEESLKAVGVK